MWAEPTKVALSKKASGEWTHKHKHMAFSSVVNGAWTQKGSSRWIGWVMKDVSNVAKKDVNSARYVNARHTKEYGNAKRHQQAAAKCKERIVWERRAHSEAMRQKNRSSMRRHRPPSKRVDKSEHRSRRPMTRGRLALYGSNRRRLKMISMEAPSYRIWNCAVVF